MYYKDNMMYKKVLNKTFPLVLQYCCFGDMKGIWPIKDVHQFLQEVLYQRGRER